MSKRGETVVRTWFQEVWNEGQDSAIDRLLAPDALAHGLPGGSMRGPDSFRAVQRTFRGAFPDINIAVERTISEGDMVVAHCHVTGTHTGNALGFPATGRRVDFYGVTITRVVDDTIREGWNCYDFLTMYQQLGVVPPNPGA